MNAIDAPFEPKNNCQFIDDMIKNQTDDLETIRERFVNLREWGKYWEYRYNDLESDQEEKIKELNEQILDLKDEIKMLKENKNE